MNETYKQITTLSSGETVKFKTKIDGSLVRTGTTGDKTSFFQALLYSINPKYKSLRKDEKAKLVESLKDSIATSFTIDDWESLGNGAVAQASYSMVYRELIDFFFNVVANPAEFLKMNENNVITKKLLEKLFIGKFIGSYEKLFKYITIEDFEKTILPTVFDPVTLEGIDDADKKIFKMAKTIVIGRIRAASKKGGVFTEESIKDIVNILYEMVHTISKNSRPIAYGSFLENLDSCFGWVDYWMLGLLMEKLDRDIYIIDSKTRLPYPMGDCNVYKSRKSIVILWVNKNSYEIIGRLLPDTKIQREFQADDPIIQKIYGLLCDPRLVSRYPELLEH